MQLTCVTVLEPLHRAENRPIIVDIVPIRFGLLASDETNDDEFAVFPVRLLLLLEMLLDAACIRDSINWSIKP